MKYLQLFLKAFRYFIGSPKCRLGTYIVLHAILIFCVVKRIKTYTREGSEMARTAYDLRTLITDQEEWAHKSLWVGQEVPRFIRHEEATEHLVSLVNRVIKDANLNIELREMRHQQQDELTSKKSVSRFENVSVEIAFRGEEKEVIAFVHRLQDPGNFAGVDHIAVDLTKFGRLSCEIKLTQWFLPPWRQVEGITVKKDS